MKKKFPKPRLISFCSRHIAWIEKDKKIIQIQISKYKFREVCKKIFPDQGSRCLHCLNNCQLQSFDKALVSRNWYYDEWCYNIMMDDIMILWWMMLLNTHCCFLERWDDRPFALNTIRNTLIFNTNTNTIRNTLMLH